MRRSLHLHALATMTIVLMLGVLTSVTYADGTGAEETPSPGTGQGPGDSDQDSEEVGPVGNVDAPVLDPDYDDQWVEDFPETVSGFNVGYISTPKDRACSSTR